MENVGDILLLLTGVVLLTIGFIGCVIPALPGPPVSFLALLSLQLTRWGDFDARFLLICAFIAIVVTALDFIVPLLGTRRYGGTRQGTWGAAIGLVVGLFFFPAGIILGPFLGAFVGEIMAHNDSDRALTAALGSLVGILAGTILKLMAAGFFTYHFVKELII